MISRYYVCDELKTVGPIENEYIVKESDHLAAIKELREALAELLDGIDHYRESIGHPVAIFTIGVERKARKALEATSQ